MAFNKIFGADSEKLVKDGSDITVGSLKKKGGVIGIYFSAHWCPPCKAFTPRLIQFYKNMQSTGRSFEVVFASSDRSASEFAEYFGSMPWAAFPHGDARIAKASRKFKVQGIPTLVLVDAETGATITTKARADVMRDPEGADFPWKPKTAKELLSGTKLSTADGGSVTWEELSKLEAVGLYFSAHWCGPCRAFTPQLKKTYDAINASGKRFEIVFVSSDRDSSGFDEYRSVMPWAALPFAERAKKEALSTAFDVEGIPTFVILNPKTGAIITSNGRAKVMGDKTGADFPWYPKPVEELGGGPDINSTAILCLQLKNRNDEDAKAALAAMTEVAKAKKAEWEAKDADEDYPIDFGFGDASTGLLGPIRNFCNISNTGNTMYIVDVPNGKKYMWSGSGMPSKTDINDMVDSYVAGSLASVGIKESA